MLVKQLLYWQWSILLIIILLLFYYFHIACMLKLLQSCPTLYNPWTVAHQAPLSMEFSRQEYWSGLPMLSSRGSSQPRDQTHISCGSCIAGGFFTTEPLGKPYLHITNLYSQGNYLFTITSESKTFHGYIASL